MTNVKMPEPVVWRSKYKSEPGMIGNYPWSYAEYSLRQTALKNYDIESLITTTQAQVYADERVREVLEKAVVEAKRVSDKYGYGYYGSEVDAVDEVSKAICALFPKQSTKETDK